MQIVRFCDRVTLDEFFRPRLTVSTSGNSGIA